MVEKTNRLNFIRPFLAMLLVFYSSFASAQKLTLFSTEQRANATQQQGIVMDFLERYFQELESVKHTTIQMKMSDDKVYFRKGNVSDLKQISDTIPFFINQHDRYYEVGWLKDSIPFLTIVFPAQYDLLLGKGQEECQMTFKDTIQKSPHRISTLKFPKGNIMVGDSIYMTKTDYLELESFNNAIYYNKVGDAYRPYYDKSHLDYSAANLFQGLIPDADYRMYVEQSVYGLKTINYSISFQQWLDYCAMWGLKIFFGVEEERADGLLLLVIAQSKELGFNHLLSVVIPDKFVTDKNAVMKVRMTPYIPIHNIKNIFQKESVNRRKVKWQ